MKNPGRLESHETGRGFSLVEVLIVMGLIAALITLGSQVSTSVIRSTELSRESGRLADEFSRASLESIRRNQPIQFRLYRFKDPFISDQALVRGYQFLILDTETKRYRELEKIRFFKGGIAVHEAPDASTLLGLPERNPRSATADGDSDGEELDRISDPELQTISPYSYYQFEFRPDGSTNLPKDQAWGVVIAYVEDWKDGQSPRDFRAIGINPFTGSIERY